jgi:hypothetical protein
MTGHNEDSGIPGRLLLKIARFVFDETALSAVVRPAIADLQHEWREAGADRRSRSRARRRGYAAFWRLVLFAPAVAVSPAHGSVITALPHRVGGGMLILLTVVLFATSWSFFAWFIAVAVATGVGLAIVLRRWHDTHPATLAPRDHLDGKRPEINLSAIPVGGNVGGLIFAAGSVLIVILGLPELRWFLTAALGSGLIAGGVLTAWRRREPSDIRPRNSIATR